MVEAITNRTTAICVYRFTVSSRTGILVTTTQTVDEVWQELEERGWDVLDITKVSG